MPTSLTRRRFLSSSLATATALQLSPRLFAATPAACTVLPEQEVGPYYVADELLRSAIAEGHAGIPLALEIRLIDSRNCGPLANAAVDLWHCDAAGVYSGYTKASLDQGHGPDGDHAHHGPPPEGFGPPPGGGRPPDGSGPPPGRGPGEPGGMRPTDKLTFCRGIQLSGKDGAVAFRTIFPGFYQGRVNHIHIKVRVGGHEQAHTYAAGHTAHTGQIFFPEELTVRLMQQEPYRSHAIHRTTSSEDGIFTGQGGSLSVASMAPLASGYRAEITLAIDPTATPAPVRGGFGGPPPPPRT